MSNIVRPPFPAEIDNTMRSSFTSCNRKFWLNYIRKWAHPVPSKHLHAGGAFAAGMETVRRAFYQQGLDYDTCVGLGWGRLHEEFADTDDSLWGNKSATRMGEALVRYFDHWRMDTDALQPAVFGGKPAIEFTFAIPLPINHPETGYPLVYCGRNDMLGLMNQSTLYVVDEKTTSYLGEGWSKRYEISGQFTGYCWGALEHGYPVVGALVRGIAIKARDIAFIEVPFMRPSYMIREWYNQLLKDVRAMITNWVDTRVDLANQWDQWAPNYADTCGAWGGCSFMPVCNIDPATRERMLEVNYVIRPWTPLKGDDND